MISLGIASERPQSDTDRIVEAVRASGKKSKPNPSAYRDWETVSPSRYRDWETGFRSRYRDWDAS